MEQILTLNFDHSVLNQMLENGSVLTTNKPFNYLSGLDITRKNDPFYYLHDFWNDVSDPDINSKPFMSGGPWGWMTVIGLIIFWIRVVGPRSMKDKDPYDMRPWILVLNGLTFGGYITGFLTGMWYSNWGMFAFSCEACDLKDQSVDMYIRKATGYSFFGGKVWEFSRLIFMVLRKRDSEITNLFIFHSFCSVFFVHLGLKLYPGGVFIFLPYVDCIFQIFSYAYLILKSAGGEMNPSNSYRVFLFWLKYIMGVLVLLHGMYFSTQDNCGPVFLKYFQVIYSFVGLCVANYEWNLMDKLRKESAALREETKQLKQE